MEFSPVGVRAGENRQGEEKSPLNMPESLLEPAKERTQIQSDTE